MIEQLLTDIGLSDKEANMYITLLRHGEQATSFLAKKGNLNRGTGYVILHSLLEKGLATKTTRGGIQYFAPLDPSHLENFLEHKKQKIESDKERIRNAMEQLVAIKNPLTEKTKMQFFDGPEGARAVLEDTLTSKEKTLSAYFSLTDLIDFVGAEFFNDYSDRRIKKGYALNAIRTRDKDKEALEHNVQMNRYKTNKKERREVRYASDDLAFPMTLYMYENKLAIISSKEENFALLIESDELSQMQKKLFALLWNSLAHKTIKVGVLYSLSGTMAISERPLVDGTLMAIDEINEAGGVLGKHIEPIVVDGMSDPDTFAREAKALITEERVSSVFGGWTSESRKMMKPVFEKYDHLLWYSVQYEGIEQSPNIIYTGSTPNQQMLPAVTWAYEHIGKRFFLVGSDYVFPRSANEIVKAYIQELGGVIVGEAYLKLGADNFENTVQKIRGAKPDVILNTINGDSNVSFFASLRDERIMPDTIPTMSFSIAEEEMSRMKPETFAGDYIAWNYLQSITSQENKKFVRNFKKKYGKHRVTDDPIVSAYFSVYLFVEAVKKAKTSEVADIRNAANDVSIHTPEGIVRIDPKNHHVHKKTRIGQILPGGQCKIVWSSKTPISPEPYPKYKSQNEWHAFLKDLYKKWGGHWSKQ